MAAPAAPSLSTDRLFSRTMVDAGELARQGERMMQRVAQAAERFGWDHGLRLQGQLRTLGHVGDRICAYTFGPGVMSLEARDYALVAVQRAVRNTNPLVAPLVPLIGLAGAPASPPADNGFLLAERAWSELVNQALDLQHDMMGVWLDLGREALGALPGFGPAARGPAVRAAAASTPAAGGAAAAR
ncbi:hypothetical protein PQJ75_15440 [Rhodoplanes sp. TEM]|uniref:Uncharacterized protein n=1 Tax=Rhodoplanes tepidamans TaxID=200616 RepID=A0ABT5JFZ8_RHOTP|nr:MULTISPECIES: hypothetical protein [Rhodoplanes]MDC7788531.1 hypothetical protein [Rhodoplanes tepidamans]MDC7985130.1 hypothetical protein [Rhodoplanes sp. TEM]MDQ0353410.1 hypothetical protein [Rhodoplanes tepidamans]